ncbi:MAG: hypothetical protein HUJ56_02065, partial [Erysipelotrichaceae bacterium]|nr:hypothetical protein [Erysipelotrichaceae bacterium]
DEKKSLEWKGKAYEICECAERDDDRRLLRLAHEACFGEDGLVIGHYAMDELAQARDYCVRMHNLIQEYLASWTSETWRAEALIEYANPHFEGFREVDPKTIYKRLEIVEEGLSILNANSFPDKENLATRASGYSVKGHLIERLNTFMTSAKKENVFEAMEAFKKSIELDEMLYNMNKTWENRRNLGLAYSSMGILLSHSPGAGFTSEDAKGWYEKAIPLHETNYQEIHLPTTQEDLAYAYGNYGMELDDPEEMKMYRDKALALLRANYEETKDEHILQNIRSYEVSYDRLLNKNNKKGLFGWLKK